MQFYKFYIKIVYVKSFSIVFQKLNSILNFSKYFWRRFQLSLNWCCVNVYGGEHSIQILCDVRFIHTNNNPYRLSSRKVCTINISYNALKQYLSLRFSNIIVLARYRPAWIHSAYAFNSVKHIRQPKAKYIIKCYACFWKEIMFFVRNDIGYNVIVICVWVRARKKFTFSIAI